MKHNVSSAGAVRYRLVVAALLMGSLAGCGVISCTQPRAQDSALAPILVPDPPYALHSVLIAAENADRVALVGELASALDGRVLAVGMSRGIYIHDAQTMEQRRFLEAPA